MLEKIRILCKKRKITICELERILEFGNGSIRRWSDSSPSIDKVLKVANYFNVKIDYLLDLEEKQLPAESLNIAMTFNNLTEIQKGLVKCYISIISSQK